MRSLIVRCAVPSEVNGETSMEYIFATAAFLLSILLLSKLLLAGAATTKKNLPPSPPSLPIIGHLHLLKKPIHHVFNKLASLHGPILFLRFGSRPVVIVSSASVAKECFTTNDVALANRPNLLFAKAFGVHMGFNSYGPQWRSLRRIFTVEILSSHRIESYSCIRIDEVKDFVSRLHHDCGPQDWKKVDLRMMFYALVFNVTMRILTGKRYFGEGVQNPKEAMKFEKIMEDACTLGGTFILGDYLPWLRWMDVFLGMEKKLAEWKTRKDTFMQAMVDERRAIRMSRRGGEYKGEDKSKQKGFANIVDIFLSLQEQEPEYFKDELITGSLFEILFGGVETTYVTLEWTMSLLFNHPEVLKKARAEIDSHTRSCKMMEDSDFPHLPYLQAIMNEALRLHPPGPLLVPHESFEDIVVNGYDIPKGTMLFVNTLAIHRDEKEWEDATKFKPERFLPTKDGGAVLNGCCSMPFGFGRRRCPGEAFATREMGLLLGTLIQCFDWERVGGVEVDMTEGDGMSIPKAVPLEVMCKTRKEMLPFLSKV